LLTGTRSDENNNAIVARLVYGKARVLFAADAEQEAEASLLASGQELSADVLKVGHHGGRTSSGSAFLNAIGATTAVLSCGRENRFGHPHKETLARLEQHKIQIFRTDTQGAIQLETEGKTLALRSLSRL
jgi:competence protein ComEC